MTKIILDLREARQILEKDAPVVVDLDGKEHKVTGIAPAVVMQLMDVPARFEELQVAVRENPEGNKEIFEQFVGELEGLIQTLVPGMDASKLYFSEMMAVVTTVIDSLGADFGEKIPADPLPKETEEKEEKSDSSPS